MGDAAGLLSGGDTPPTLRLHVAVRAVRLSTVVVPLRKSRHLHVAGRCRAGFREPPGSSKPGPAALRACPSLVTSGSQNRAQRPHFCGWKGEKGNTINGT
jgi:hypothetical protein